MLDSNAQATCLASSSDATCCNASADGCGSEDVLYLTPAEPLAACYVGSFAICVDGKTFDYSATYGRGGVITKLCRDLTKLGYDPDRTIRALRDGKPVCRIDQPIMYWAGLTVREDDRLSAKLVAYREGPSKRPPVVAAG